jgi:hypothetical protein
LCGRNVEKRDEIGSTGIFGTLRRAGNVTAVTNRKKMNGRIQNDLVSRSRSPLEPYLALTFPLPPNGQAKLRGRLGATVVVERGALVSLRDH